MIAVKRPNQTETFGNESIMKLVPTKCILSTKELVLFLET